METADNALVLARGAAGASGDSQPFFAVVLRCFEDR